MSARQMNAKAKRVYNAKVLGRASCVVCREEFDWTQGRDISLAAPTGRGGHNQVCSRKAWR